MSNTQFPATRMRRARQAPWVRNMVQTHTLTPSDLIWPLFVIEGKNIRTPIAAMPGVERFSIDLAVKQAREAALLGIPCIALFPNTPDHLRSSDACEAWNPENLMCRAIRAIKAEVPEIGIMADVALDPYTTHGHDGIVENDYVQNDKTVAALVKQAVCLANAGADIVAPSDMMDGRIGAIRTALEAGGLHNTLIMAYSAKYASAYYGPFRDAVGTIGRLKGDKKTYQMQPANHVREAIAEAQHDIAEGADFVMVKPGLPYLDVLAAVAQACDRPTFAYQVSGEYTMLQLAFAAGALERETTIYETLIAFKRAGASGIITYFAKEMAAMLKS